MFDLKSEWNISLAGCGFTSIYYVGAFSCFLEKTPYLVKGASTICGASSGSLFAAVLAIGMNLEQCCENMLSMAKEARTWKLSSLHPSFNLLKMVRQSLQRDLPVDAHLRASGRLCVSLTRVSDGKNVLVSQFNSKEELIQVLLCSCFFPLYCGVIPPVYHGVRYVDGALSNNMPYFDRKNTITVCPFSGESDVCPRGGTLNVHEYRQHNTSIKFNSSNLHRIVMSFLPPETQVMAEICRDGYMDALRFLREGNLLSSESPSARMQVYHHTTSCCEFVNESTEAIDAAETESTKTMFLGMLNPPPKQHCWLDTQSIQNIPVPIKQVLCQACQESHAGSLYSQATERLPLLVAAYLFLPVELAYCITKRFLNWLPEMPSDLYCIYGLAADVCMQTWKKKAR